MPHYDVTFRFRAESPEQATDRAQMLLEACQKSLLHMVGAEPARVETLEAVVPVAFDSAMKPCDECRRRQGRRIFGVVRARHVNTGLSADGKPLEKCEGCGTVKVWRQPT
jgi:hypothetical protein